MARLSFRLSPEQLHNVCRPCDDDEPPDVVSSPFVALKEVPLAGVQTLRPRPKVAPSSHNLSFKFGSAEQVKHTGGNKLHGANVEGVTEQDTLWAVPKRLGESRIETLCLDVLCARRRIGPAPANALLPQRGHLETFSARTHLLAGVFFAVYTITRFAMLGFETLKGTLVVIAGLAATICFFSSTLYHVTSPDPHLSKWSRQLDFVSIYISIAIGWTADLCVTTREFENVRVAAIVDVPLAVLLLGVFFGTRRYILWDEVQDEEFKCSIGLGLYRKWNSDGVHQALRQSTSLTVSLFTFSLLPVIVSNLGSATSTVILLQVASFLIILSGMVLDNAVVFPDYALSRGGAKSCVVPSCGCILSAHGWWHVFAFVGTAIAVLARELALYHA